MHEPASGDIADAIADCVIDGHTNEYGDQLADTIAHANSATDHGAAQRAKRERYLGARR